MQTTLLSEFNQDRPGWFGRFADRWIWVFMATLFLATALAGFIPRSLQRLDLIEAGKHAPFALITHLHAVTMGTWLLLLFVQAMLVATGRRRWHQTLGKTSLVMGPAVAASLIAITVHGVTSQLADLTLSQLSDLLAFALFVQGKAIFLFSLYFVWGCTCVCVNRTCINA